MNIPGKAGVQVIDLDKVEYIINGLSYLEKESAIKSGLRSASLVFLSGGKQRLRQRMKRPEGVTGNLINSFAVRVKRAKLGALAGFSKTNDANSVGFSSDGGKGYHAHLVDRGTVVRYTKKSNANRGIMPGNLFWTDTINQDSNKAVDKLYTGIERAVVRIINRRK